MQRTPHSYLKNGKERKNVALFWKERMPNPAKKVYKKDHTLTGVYILTGGELQGWEFTYSLIRSDHSNQMSDCEWFAQIAKDKWATVSESLRSLMSKERLWANCSGCSWQMSNREQFTQVDHDKWANEPFAQKN